MDQVPSHQAAAASGDLHWRSLIAAIGAISVVGVAIGLGAPLLSVVLESRGFSPGAIGLNSAVAGIASLVAAPIATPVAARFGVVPTMILSIIVGAAAFAGFHFATAFWMWFPLRAALHIALTFLFILSEYWINVSAPPHRRGLVLGIYATVLSLGFALGPLIFSQIGSQGFLPFGVAVSLVGLAAIPVIAAWRESPTIGGAHEQGGPFWRYLWLVPTATAAVLVFGAVETGGFALFPVYGVRLGFSEQDTALLLSMIGLGNVALQIPLGLVSDRVRDRRLLLAGCATVGLIGIVFLPVISHSWHVMAITLFFWGGSVAALYTIGLAHLGSRLTGRDLASANAAFVFCYGLGMVLGPQTMGSAMDLFGPQGFAYAAALFFALYLLIVIPRILAGSHRA